MWETYGLENEDLLWASAGLFGGIGGQQQATCGAVAAGAVALGYRHRCPLSDDEAVKKAKLVIEKEASELAKEFTKEFGTVVCIDLVGIDFSVPEQRRRYFAENITKDTCDRFVAFAVRKLYELEDKRSQS